MACGLPIICSEVAGCVADLVENGWNGRVFSAGDVSQLTFAMDELARDAELGSLMGQRSRERIAQYSPAAWAAGMASAAPPYRRRAA
jgi:glycosyltransferase involved in cell wall biosynthesis